MTDHDTPRPNDPAAAHRAGPPQNRYAGLPMYPVSPGWQAMPPTPKEPFILPVALILGYSVFNGPDYKG